MGKGKYPTPAHWTYPPLRGEAGKKKKKNTWETFAKLIVQRHRLTERLRSTNNHRTLNTSYPPYTPHQHITKGLLTAVFLHSTSWLAFQGKQTNNKQTITRYTNRQKTIWRDRAIIQAKHAGMLELSGQKFKTAIMNILRALVRKCRQYGQEQTGKH